VFEFRYLSLLAEGRDTDGESMHTDANEAPISQLGQVEGCLEDMWLIRDTGRSER